MKEDMPALTGIRGLAALVVLFYHYHVPGFGQGGRAVDVFFALSGFVLAHVYRDGLNRADFLWARFARVAPTHFVATGAFCGIAVFFGSITWGQALAGVALTAIVNPPTWSLAVEIYDYLLFALLIPLPAARRVPPWVLVIGGTVLGLAGILAYRYGIWPELSCEVTRGIGWFSVGIGIYRLGWRPTRTWLLDNPLSLWLGAISYPLYLIHFTPLNLLTWLGRPWLGIAASFGLAVLLHHFIEVPARRWLRALPRQFAGMKKAGTGFPPSDLFR